MRRVLAISLSLFGIVCLLWYWAETRAAENFQQQQNAVLNKALAARKTPAPRAQRVTVALHGLVGRLEIPRLHMKTIVIEGDDDGALKKAAGHLPDTALPWDRGNTVIAAHRDTFFRPLQDVRPGDEIRLVSPRGSFVYRVRNTGITGPDDVKVLAPTGNQAELTLLTCYPFYYVGSAPKRFVVRAVRLTGS